MGEKKGPSSLQSKKKYPKIVFFLPELGAFGKFSVLYGFTMYGNSRSRKRVVQQYTRWYLERYTVGKIMLKNAKYETENPNLN